MTQTPDSAAPPPPPPGQAPQQPPSAQAPVPPGLVGPENNDARTMAMLCHLLAIFTLFIAPLIIWLIKKDQSRFVDQQGKEVINFTLTLLIGFVVGVATSCLGIGVVIIIAVKVVNIVFGIISTLAVNKGQPYRYPICIRFIK
jgi:uncharacterized Tic20 family protein